jgi:hypothetical protein
MQSSSAGPPDPILGHNLVACRGNACVGESFLSPRGNAYPKGEGAITQREELDRLTQLRVRNPSLLHPTVALPSIRPRQIFSYSISWSVSIGRV